MKHTSLTTLFALFVAGSLWASFGSGARTVLASTAAACSTITAANLDDCVRMNQVQVLGTHNSYHIAPKPAILAGMGERAQGLEYTHRPLTQQLSDLGVRQFELDVYADPDGGRYAHPTADRLTGDAPNPAMTAPGFKVFHVQDLDVHATCSTLIACLTEIEAWSTAHPAHLPLMIMIETKDGVIKSRPDFTFVEPHAIGVKELNALDAEIRSVFGPDRVITPDTVRGRHETLEAAVRAGAWPTLRQARGKVLFALDNTDHHRDDYLQGHPGLRGRMIFVTAPDKDAASAFLKLNDSLDTAHIRDSVTAGFLVRTRADEPTREARSGDTTHQKAAFGSGAQFVSTDYPEVSPFGSGYVARLPGPAGLIARCNPVNAPAGCRDEWLEPSAAR